MPKFTLAPAGADDFRCSAGLFPFGWSLPVEQRGEELGEPGSGRLEVTIQ